MDGVFSSADAFPQLSSSPVSVELYIDETLFARQKETIFRHCWLMAGLSSQIPEDGDFFTKTIPTLGISLIFARAPGGQINGFYNACRHRGTEVCLKSEGRARRFTCPFHNWSYDLAGKLIGIPDGKSFSSLRKADYGLIPVQTSIWGNFIFFNLGPNPQETLLEFLGGVADAFTGFPFDKFTSYYNVSSKVDSNWISILDGARESYHVFALHRNSGAAANSAPDHLGKLLHARDLGHHGMVSFWGNTRYQPSKLETLAAGASPDRGSLSGGSGTKHPVAGLNPSQSPDWALDVYAIFPNLLLQTNGSVMVTQQTWPLSAGRTVYDFSGYFEPARNAAERFAQEHAMAQTRDILSEDMNTYKRTQSNYENGVIKNIFYGDQEVLLRHQHNAVLKWLDSAPIQH